MKILVLGANGFIGSHLCEAILAKTDWQIYAMDLAQNHLAGCLKSQSFHFALGDMTREQDWLSRQLDQCDVMVPLAAIATPSTYVEDPLRVFALDFEANLSMIRQCVQAKKHLLFPSTSEVYGMCPDEQFDEESSTLVTGPIHKERWIYASSKQLLDRIIYAYGRHHGLAYTLFRPFNWYGPRLDNLFNPKPGGSRVLTQFIGNIMRGEPIALVDGGDQQRCFTYVDDGIDALLRMVREKNGAAYQRIFNVGNPYESVSIRTLAEKIKAHMQDYAEYAANARQTAFLNVSADQYYGAGYQDVKLRVPSMERAEKYLGWKPTMALDAGLKKTLAYYFQAEKIA